MPIAEYAASAASFTSPGEVRLERLELLDVDGDTGALHVREQVHQRQLHVGEQPGAAALLELGVERLGQVEHRPRLQHRGVAGGVLPRSSKDSCPWSAGSPALSSRLR